MKRQGLIKLMSNQGDDLKLLYRTRFRKLAKYRNEVWKILCDQYFSAFISPQAHLLDLGSGWGEFINNVKAEKKYAMDLNPDAQSWISKDVHFLHQDCSQKWQIHSKSLSVVFTSNFLEHLPSKDNVERTISEVHRCLKDGGLFICLGPNIRCLPGEYWDFWDHCVPISDISLSELLDWKGFSIQLNVPRFLPYSMSTGKTPPLVLVRLYLKLPVVWPLFGKQFLLVGRKRCLPGQ